MSGSRGAPGAPSFVLFVCLPLLVLGLAVGLRTSGRVQSATGVMARLRPLVPLVRAVAARERVPPELLLAVASAESGGRADARSGKGAVGLLQLMPGTAADMARRGREPEPVLTDPETSLRLGARYLRLQRERYARWPQGEELALCAYNAGPSNVDGWLRERPPDPAASPLGDWVPWTEPRAYVRRVAAWQALWEEELAGNVN